MKRTLIASLAFAALAACNTTIPPASITGFQLSGTSWRQRIAQAGVQIPAGAQAPTIVFGADGRASGYAGCNQWFATVTSAPGGNLRFGAIGTTRRMCAPEAMEVERLFLDALAYTRAADFDADAGTLRLVGTEADDRGTFEAMPTSARR